jgi:inhibitor of cysteine peptidase
MVQKEVKKKTKIYGTVAILSAIILVTLIYSFGAVPAIFPPSHTPLVAGMKTFGSIEELKNYLANTSASSFSGGPLDSKFFGSSSISPMATPLPMPASASLTLGSNGFGAEGTNLAIDSYSSTNIQVAGVDEADTVKTDGSYIYTLSTIQSTDYSSGYYPQTSNVVYILSADPQNPRVVAKISLGGDTEPAGLFLSSDGSKLVVLASKYQTYSYGYGGISTPRTAPSLGVSVMPMLAYYQSDVYTYINVYDVTNKGNPTLERNFTVSGSYFNSRMIGNTVYAVVSQPAMVYNNAVTLPQVCDGNSKSTIAPSTVYYSDMVQPAYFTFTSFYGIDVSDSTQQPTNMTVMMGGASTMYVSPSNIYVTYPTWTDGGQYTSIYRVSINGSNLAFKAKGNVPGNVLNQYSMDEYSGNFRIATNWYANTQMNNVYVLNSNLTTIGKLEGLAENENLHSVRFMGDKCYLVTFKMTDPLFVIDLSQPENPKVLGELKIPGYSDYLHPYDETHLIGVGKEAVDSKMYDFAYYLGLKLALFDVSDVNNPLQLSNYVIGDRGTDSAALSDPKAFLFNKTIGLLVIPVNLAQVDNSTGQATDSSYGQLVWQGAYVFNVSLDGGFTLKGTVTHLNDTVLSQAADFTKNPYGYYTETSIYTYENYWITRALYIGNTLYTISNSEVKLNSLTDMAQIGQINLT